jgi:DHA1 family bicyclomycin/chloramphenicol resistance-like MFS transporter
MVLIIFLNSHNPLYVTLAFMPFIISQIISSSLLFPLCLNFIPEAKAKVAAILQGGRLVFSALSLQVAGYLYQGTFRNIGIIISIFILLVIITMYYLRKNHELMNVLQE